MENQNIRFSKHQCVRCNSSEDLGHHTMTRKMMSKSQFVTTNRRLVTYQNLVYKFPICRECRNLFERWEKIATWLSFFILGWIIGFGALGFFLWYDSRDFNIIILFIPLVVIGAISLKIVSIILTRSKMPKRHMKIKVKFRGYDHGKKYDGFPMVKPLNSKKWINCDTCIESM